MTHSFEAVVRIYISTVLPLYNKNIPVAQSLLEQDGSAIVEHPDAMMDNDDQATFNLIRFGRSFVIIDTIMCIKILDY